MTYCLFCMRNGHLTSDCWNKNKYIKEINRDNNGKFRKTYVSRYQPTEKIYVSNKNKERKTSKKKDEGKLCKNRNITDDEKDETVRGCLPLFKLSSRADREAWQKLVEKDFFTKRRFEETLENTLWSKTISLQSMS